jgi:metal-sulfur cluster biosynthetic enzyme
MKEEFFHAAAPLGESAPGPSGVSNPSERRLAGPTDHPVDEAAVMDALSTVIDPEIGVDIVSLGLVYEIDCDSATVRVVFSLTTPGCPLEAVITDGIVRAVEAVPGVTRVSPELVWHPRWHPGMIREGAW